MGKTANCIKMIRILSDGNIYSIADLASRLETNPRNIIAYRDEIEMVGGYCIVGVPGEIWRIPNGKDGYVSLSQIDS